MCGNITESIGYRAHERTKPMLIDMRMGLILSAPSLDIRINTPPPQSEFARNRLGWIENQRGGGVYSRTVRVSQNPWIGRPAGY